MSSENEDWNEFEKKFFERSRLVKMNDILERQYNICKGLIVLVKVAPHIVFITCAGVIDVMIRRSFWNSYCSDIEMINEISRANRKT